MLSTIAYRDEEEAIAVANDTSYGLQAYVVTPDAQRARAIAGRLDAGRVLINKLAHAPLVLFGGFKLSGIGREYGHQGLEAYLKPESILGFALS